MRTMFLNALGVAFAQAPGGGQAANNGPAISSSSQVAGAAGAVSSSSAAAGAPAATTTMDMGPWSDVDHLEGTWQSKSGMVVTGPDFYDPVHELLIDPGLPGISYSFTSDGHWEQAIYQIQGDGSKPTCPTAALIFQHGTYELLSNGSLSLTPIADDGRQLLSDPCGSSGNESVYSRYEQPILFKQFEVLVDNYHGRYRLNLYGFDGTPVAPLYLAYKPPQMLPTETMNPTGKSTGSSARARVKRHLENSRSLRERGLNAELRATGRTSYDYLWYAGVSMMVGGGLALAVLS